MYFMNDNDYELYYNKYFKSMSEKCTKFNRIE